jgi:hypothetical protein
VLNFIDPVSGDIRQAVVVASTKYDAEGHPYTSVGVISIGEKWDYQAL